MKINKHRLTIYCIIFLAALDIITRNNAQLYFDPNKTIWIIKGILGLTYRINYGGMLGVGSNWRFFRIFSILLSTSLLTLFFVYYSKLHHYLNLLLRSFFILDVASLVGHLPDRIFLGYTRDWITWFGPGTPNLADVYFFTSYFLLFIGLILHPDVTWKVFKRWCCLSSAKNQLGLHLFQKGRGENDEEF